MMRAFYFWLTLTIWEAGLFGFWLGRGFTEVDLVSPSFALVWGGVAGYFVVEAHREAVANHRQRQRPDAEQGGN